MECSLLIVKDSVLYLHVTFKYFLIFQLNEFLLPWSSSMKQSKEHTGTLA